MGRADQTTKIRGMFVHPGQIDRVVKRHAEIARARLVVRDEGGKDTAVLLCEVAGAPNEAEVLVAAIAGSVQAECKLRADVRIVSRGEIANDGKVIEDQRSYE